MSRAAQIKKMEGKLRYPDWSERRTDDELLRLAALVRDNKNIKARWEAFKCSDLYRAEDTQASFKSVEGYIRNYVKLAKEAGENYDADVIRLAIGSQQWSDSYENLLSDIDSFVERGDGSLHEPIEISPPKSDVGFDILMGLASLIGYSIVLVPVGLIALWMLGVFDPSPEEIALRKQQEATAREARLDECVDRLGEDIRRSCQRDPEFSYCGFNYERHEIMGSGCTTAVKSQGGYQQQVDFCTTKSLSSVKRTCAIEIYGCAAVTGNVNC